MQSKIILLAFSALLGLSTAQNVSTIINTNTTSTLNGTAHVSTIYAAYTTVTTAYPSHNYTVAGNNTKVEVTTTWAYNSSDPVSYSNVTLTAPALTEGTASVEILAATGTPTPGIVTSYYIIPASSILAQETSGTENAAVATGSSAAGRVSGAGAGILGVAGIMGYLAI